jgi:hypothetical protein
VSAVLACILLGVVVLAVLNAISSNKEAIEKSCILLNNVVIRSTGQPPDPSLQLLINEIVQDMDSQTRTRYRELQRLEQQQNREEPPLTVDCEKVAQDPDSIRAIQVEPQ